MFVKQQSKRFKNENDLDLIEFDDKNLSRSSVMDTKLLLRLKEAYSQLQTLPIIAFPVSLPLGTGLVSVE